MQCGKGSLCLIEIITTALIISISFVRQAETFLVFHRNTQMSFLARWKELQTTIYDGNSVPELLNKCPNGCTPTCVFTKKIEVNLVLVPVNVPCSSQDEIAVLEKAQEILRGWQELIQRTQTNLIIHGVMEGIIFLLILVLIFRGHYRIRDLWFLPADRQWELERDPTWGLPGKVWSLLMFRVVKSSKKEPTQRKYLSYTDNPTVMGNRFWYYKQALREMYKKHQYYKRNRHFHKLAWQITKLGKFIPETLRPHKEKKRLVAQVDVLNPSPTTPENDIRVELPWEIDLADEINQVYLQQAKDMLREEIKKEKAQGYFINGRFQPPIMMQLHQHHHRRAHHHHNEQEIQPPLTKEEVIHAARKLEDDPMEGYVTVEGVTKLRPDVKGQLHVHHHHHKHPNRELEVEMIHNILKLKELEQEMQEQQLEQGQDMK